MKITGKSEKYFPYEIQITRDSWENLQLESVARQLLGRPGTPDIIFYRHVASRLNQEAERQGKSVKAGNLFLYGLLTRIYRYLMTQYTAVKEPGILDAILKEEGLEYHLGELKESLHGFVEHYPGSMVIDKTARPVDYLSAEDPADRRKKMIVREFLLLSLSCQNPALDEFRVLFDDTGLVVSTPFREVVSALDKSVQKGVLHKNTASRYKGRLAARVKAVRAKAS